MFSTIMVQRPQRDPSTLMTDGFNFLKEMSIYTTGSSRLIIFDRILDRIVEFNPLNKNKWKMQKFVDRIIEIYDDSLNIGSTFVS